MATIGIDCRFADAKAGLGTYTRKLVPTLLPLLSAHQVVLFTRSEPLWAGALPPFVRVVDAPFAPYSIGEHLEFPNVVQAEKIDLFYAPHFNVPYLLSVPSVCTVHDLILHQFTGSAGFFKRLAYRSVLRRALKRSRSIITISNATAKDLHSRYGESIFKKCTVAYPGVSKEFSPRSETEQNAVREKYRLDQPYLLYVGGCKEHKNVQMLIDAFLDAGLGETELVLIANGRECVALKKSEHIRFLSDIADAELPALYSASLGSVTATNAEGFYLPGIEAMACSVPVLATTVGAIPEVLGEHALLTEPERAALTNGIRQLITDPSLRSPQKLQAAKTWAAKYAWEKAAKEVLHNLT